jgi:hypothetical protein
MNIGDYLDLYQLIEHPPSTRESNRAFGLEHEKAKPLEQLAAWTDRYKKQLDQPRWSETYARYAYGAGLVVSVVAFVAGVLSGAVLLSYNGVEPVNVVYFLAMAVVVPLMTMGLALLSMTRANKVRNALVHLSPASWLERIVRRFTPKISQEMGRIPVHPLLANWLVIERAQMMAWWFAVGLLAALVAIVATRDVAFAWSTTLSVGAEQFHALMEAIAWPWRSWVPSAVPSVELIEQSQHYRLGGTLDAQMVRHAAMLGAWWLFLAMATLVYAVVLRAGMWLVARRGLRRAVHRAMLMMDGVDPLLAQMNTPLVTTVSHEHESAFASGADGYVQHITKLDGDYDAALGWAMDSVSMRVMLDALKVKAGQIEDVGGTRTLAEDEAILQKVGGIVVLFVKSWEPPTMDAIDFLTELAAKTNRVIVAPVGIPEQGYAAAPAEVAIWSRKLQSIKHSKVWLWTTP